VTREGGDAIARLGARIVAMLRDGPAGIAVSGGGDSTALLLAALEAGIAVRAVTVDHGLRTEAAHEARCVARFCAARGVPHDVLTLALPAGANLQARAREARYQAIADWAAASDTRRVLLGHTADDVAETLVMRLSRGAGLDGLARMATRRRDRGVEWLRPGLDVTRAGLRAALAARGVVPIEDPTNDDPAHARIAARRAIAALGLDTAALAASAEALSEARGSLVARAAAIATLHVREDRGDLLLDRSSLAAIHAIEPDPLPRLLLAGLRWVGGRAYGPRRAERQRLVETVLEGDRCTLGGCLVSSEGDHVRIAREVAAVAAPGPADAPWDGRWRLDGPSRPGLTVGALGKDIGATPWRETGLPRASLLASPAIRDGPRLIAAPLAGLAGAWTARTVEPFTETLIRR
jgi:tRNA(Ile)-lysidine synthase